MKQESYRLINDQVRRTAITYINSLECDGKVQVVISATGSKSSRQRGLQWRWCTDVANSGTGENHEDTKEGVHMLCKYRFALPIFIRDDPFFSDLYTAYKRKWGGEPDRMRYFIEHHVSTEDFNVSQMAEYLTCMQQHYLEREVSLTNPDDMGLLRI